MNATDQDGVEEECIEVGFKVRVLQGGIVFSVRLCVCLSLHTMTLNVSDVLVFNLELVNNNNSNNNNKLLGL